VQVPEVYLSLGRLLARFPKTAREAERYFISAARIAPDDANVQYEFGCYYESIKNKGRARERYRNALTLDPRHPKAREKFRELAPKESSIGTLKKLWT
jgi:Flp pilus assembly protein TadD